MPFYNADATIAAAIRSALHQTCSDWELVMCDDGSSDGSLASVRQFNDPRITVWSDGRNKGLAARLNECIDRARGRYIARMDADDLNYSHRLATQLRFLETHTEVDLVGSQMLVFGEDGEAIGKRVLPLTHGEICANPQIGFGMGHPTWLGRAEWFRKWRYRPEALRYEDVELLYRSNRDSRFANVPDVLYGYREPKGGFRKRLKTRAGRVRFLREADHSVISGSGVVQAAVAESLKSVSDAVIVSVGMRYQYLRRREQALTAAESNRWQQIYQNLNCPEPVE